MRVAYPEGIRHWTQFSQGQGHKVTLNCFPFFPCYEEEITNRCSIYYCSIKLEKFFRKNIVAVH